METKKKEILLDKLNGIQKFLGAVQDMSWNHMGFFKALEFNAKIQLLKSDVERIKEAIKK